MDSEDQLSAGIISNPFSNVDFGYGAGENGTPELQPSKITSVFGNAVERARMDSEGQLSVGLISNPFPMLILVMAQAKMEHLNCSLSRSRPSSATRGNAPGWTLRVSYQFQKESRRNPGKISAWKESMKQFARN